MTQIECTGLVITIQSRFHWFCNRENVYNKEIRLNECDLEGEERKRSSQMFSQLHHTHSCAHPSVKPCPHPRMPSFCLASPILTSTHFLLPKSSFLYDLFLWILIILTILLVYGTLSLATYPLCGISICGDRAHIFYPTTLPTVCSQEYVWLLLSPTGDELLILVLN